MRAGELGCAEILDSWLAMMNRGDVSETQAPLNTTGEADPFIAPALVRAIRSIRLVAFNFDGVFTDNMVYAFEDGREAVRCYRGDGIGLSKLGQAGITPVIISTEPNPGSFRAQSQIEGPVHSRMRGQARRAGPSRRRIRSRLFGNCVRRE